MANSNSYYLYQKYEKRGNQPWIPCFPLVYSANGDGTMPLVIKQQDDPACNLETRWVVAVDEYECSGTTKMTKEKEQQCVDGVTWIDTGNHRAALPVLEYQSGDCGYVAPKFTLTLNDSSIITALCNNTSSVTKSEISTYASSTVSAEIGDCVTTIGYECFLNCSRLIEVSFSDSVTTVNDGAFYDCSGLTGITLGDNLTSIGNAAFYKCTNLKNVVIPASITAIGHVSSSGYIGGVFKKCTGLTSITCLATVPPYLYPGSLDDTNNCPIYVPAESVDAYKTASSSYSGWPNYSSRIQAIS